VSSGTLVKLDVMRLFNPATLNVWTFTSVVSYMYSGTSKNFRDFFYMPYSTYICDSTVTADTAGNFPVINIF
jgi:hypothetical protein